MTRERDALVRIVEETRVAFYGLLVIGEAVGRVAPATLEREPAIPWPSVRALRPRLAHAYDEIDAQLLWQVLRRDLPALGTAVVRLLDER